MNPAEITKWCVSSAAIRTILDEETKQAVRSRQDRDKKQFERTLCAFKSYISDHMESMDRIAKACDELAAKVKSMKNLMMGARRAEKIAEDFWVDHEKAIGCDDTKIAKSVEKNVRVLSILCHMSECKYATSEKMREKYGKRVQELGKTLGRPPYIGSLCEAVSKLGDKFV